MNFLTGALNLLSASSIPYTLKEKIVDPGIKEYPHTESIWSIYNGINPKDETLVSVFEFNLRDPSSSAFEPLARNAFKKLKLFRHPDVLSVVDYIENDSHLYIVTERVVPLSEYLEDNKDRILSDAKVYGLNSLVRALLFVNSKANCIHGNLNFSSSVFVNPQGDWKLFGFELSTNLTSDPDQPIYRLSRFLPGFLNNVPPEVSSSGIEFIRSSPFLFDSFKLGIFIYLLFNTSSFRRTPVLDSSKNISKPATFSDRSKIPRQMSSVFKLVSGGKRLTIESFLRESESFFLSNPLVVFSNLLEEVKFENSEQKLSFFKHDVAQYIDGDFPPGYLDNKLLPEIINQFNILSKQKPTVNSTPQDHQNIQETMSILLGYILKLNSGLSEEMFLKLIKPVIFHAFTLQDRSIRLALLNNLSGYSEFLSESDVQSKIFYNLLTGFQDSNFVIREATLTSISTLIDKISTKQVNQDLLKVLAKLQMDPKPSIRTNTLILIITISQSIYATSRNNVVITAFAKSLRDSFTPCKLAALSGFERLIDSFSLEEICSKVLGNLAISLMDPKSFKVRMEAKRVFEVYLNAVEKHAAGLSQVEEDEDAEEKEFYKKVSESDGSKGQDSASQKPNEASSFGWGMMNKLVFSEPTVLDSRSNSTTPDITNQSGPKLNAPKIAKAPLRTAAVQPLRTTVLQQKAAAIQQKATVTQQDWNELESDDGWDAFDEESETVEPPVSKPVAQNLDGTAGIRLAPRAAAKTSGQKLANHAVSSFKLVPSAEGDEDEDQWGDEW